MLKKMSSKTGLATKLINSEKENLSRTADSDLRNKFDQITNYNLYILPSATRNPKVLPICDFIK